MNTLYAFSDLSLVPTTFDFVSFLVQAEEERLKIGCDNIHVVIVHTATGGFRSSDLATYRKLGAVDYTEDQLAWRLRNIIIPSCSLIPSCSGVSVFKSREDALILEKTIAKYIFPPNYSVEKPIERLQSVHWVRKESLPSIQATPEALRYVKQWLKCAGDRKIIAITLRGSAYSPKRNSNLKDWGNFARSLDYQYFPIAILDTDIALDKKPWELYGIEVFQEASFNIELRAALYELSYLNMSINNGPNLLFIFNHKARYLVFKMISDSGTSAASKGFFQRMGWNVGGQFPFATPFQCTVWEDDNLDVIQREFRDMCERIEAQ